MGILRYQPNPYAKLMMCQRFGPASVSIRLPGVVLLPCELSVLRPLLLLWLCLCPHATFAPNAKVTNLPAHRQWRTAAASFLCAWHPARPEQEPGSHAAGTARLAPHPSGGKTCSTFAWCKGGTGALRLWHPHVRTC